jgi:hypothetical protein
MTSFALKLILQTDWISDENKTAAFSTFSQIKILKITQEFCGHLIM